MVGDNHRDTTVIKSVPNTCRVDFKALDVETELAPKKLFVLRYCDLTEMDKDLGVVSSVLKKLLMNGGVD